MNNTIYSLEHPGTFSDDAMQTYKASLISAIIFGIIGIWVIWMGMGENTGILILGIVCILVSVIASVIYVKKRKAKIEKKKQADAQIQTLRAQIEKKKRELRELE